MEQKKLYTVVFESPIDSEQLKKFLDQAKIPYIGVDTYETNYIQHLVKLNEIMLETVQKTFETAAAFDSKSN
jgi:diketogulonate reductase-like aldo/keto reductase